MSISLSYLFINTAYADTGVWKLTSGVDYSTGDYGDDSSTVSIVYLPFSAAYQKDQWTFNATVPWLEVDAPASVLGGGDGGVIVDQTNRDASSTFSRAGLGDIWVSAQYEVLQIPYKLFYLDLTGKLKLPSADEERGLGTGQTDYTLQADLLKPFSVFTSFATVAYKIKGDTDSRMLDNVFYLSFGADYRASPTINLGASIDLQEAATSSSRSAAELFTYVNWKQPGTKVFSFYSYLGLSSGSPDIGLGFQVSYRPQL